MLVSHRPEHKMSGALHDETNYGRPRREGGKDIVHIRKPVAGLSATDIENIVDPAIRQAVRLKSESLAGDLSRCPAGNNWPTLAANDGRSIPIKRVRIRKALKTTPIASGLRERHVAVANNHHVAVFALLGPDGREKRWESIAVSLFEAMDRKRRNLPIVQKTYPDAPDAIFKFSLMGGDTVELHRACKHKEGICKPEIYRLRVIATNGQLGLIKLNDARLVKDIKANHDWWSPMADALRSLDCRKVVVDLLGRVHPAND
jgi:hypothetical protein